MSFFRRPSIVAFSISVLMNSTALAETVLEEVIVTANKRAESLQEISSSVTALSGELMESAGIENFFDVADLTPGMIQQTENEVTVRGIGRNGGDVAFASAVAVHENGFFLPTGSVWPLVDMGAVEIVRGPAGTVFGRNATGGAINAKWRSTEAALSGGLDVLAGDYNHQRIQGFANVPIIENDRLLTRWAFAKAEHDGHMHNTYTSPQRDPENRDEWLWRVAVTSRLTDSIDLGLRHMHWYRDNAYIYGSPDRETRQSGVLESLGAESLPPETNRFQANVNEKNGGRPGWDRIRRSEMELTWQFGALPLLGDTEMHIQGGQQTHLLRRITDLDATEIDIVYQNQPGDNYVNNAELRFSGRYETGVNWMLGVFWARFFDDEGGTDITAILPVSASAFTPLPVPTNPSVIIRAEIDDPIRNRTTKSQAVFFNATAELQTLFDSAPNVELFAGYRINEDDVAIERLREQVVFIPQDAPAPAQDTATLTQAAADFREPTWEIGAKWFINDDHMLYVKRAKGYKAGAVESTGGVLNRVDPEILQAWEIGSKSSFMERSLTVNLAAFHYGYTDLQVLFLENLESRTENAASATITGLEAEIQWRPVAGLTALLSASWLRAQFDDYCTTDPTFPQGFTDAACANQGGERDLSGNSMNNAPDFTLAMVLSYRWDLGKAGTLTPLLKVVHIDDTYVSPTNLSRYRIDAFTQTDFRLAWQSPEGAYTLEAFVEGLENHEEIMRLPVSVGVENTLFFFEQVPPRTAGIQFKYRF